MFSQAPATIPQVDQPNSPVNPAAQIVQMQQMQRMGMQQPGGMSTPGAGGGFPIAGMGHGMAALSPNPLDPQRMAAALQRPQ